MNVASFFLAEPQRRAECCAASAEGGGGGSGRRTEQSRGEGRRGGGRRKGECWGRDLFEGSPIFISLLKIIDVISEEGEDVPCSDSCCEEGEDVPYSGDVSAEWECGKEYAKHSVERIVLIFNNSIT